MRLINHANFLLVRLARRTTPQATPRIGPYLNTPEFCMLYVDRGHNHWAHGMRCFYLSVPLFMWLFGPSWMIIVGMAGLIGLLFYVDYLGVGAGAMLGHAKLRLEMEKLYPNLEAANRAAQELADLAAHRPVFYPTRAQEPVSQPDGIFSPRVGDTVISVAAPAEDSEQKQSGHIARPPSRQNLGVDMQFMNQSM